MIIKLRPTTPLITYKSYGQETSKTNRGQPEESQINLKKGTYSGNFTEGARKRASTIGSFIIERYKRKLFVSNSRRNASKPTLAFITLTIPSSQTCSDKEFKRKYINRFIIELRRRYRSFNYIWRAENQQNGNIHFHFIIDKFIHKNWLSNTWYNVLHGDEFYPNKLSQTEIYRLPATNVQQCRTAKGAKDYILKYLCKNEEKKPIDGRLWASNLNYSDCTGVRVDVGYSGWSRYADDREKNRYPVYAMDFCTIIGIDTMTFIRKFYPELLPIYLEYLNTS